MELRRQVLIQKLQQLNVWQARDGRLLREITLSDLELEYSRALDRKGVRV
ncbi:Fur-regulated basic protein FbpA [Fictibacillus fluitans]|uniref:Fur-regulated basic protein FbpA n=1 Tax=Fictibacillus fluitans TaxID=3058422 RepID=A0ABT8HX40_9BACL|nr:Fur-regulated basic protein FbpA [Fictibacillus sp. NE201]MDN4525348.1 Fur-regulated basic protein FbpA [Fictibacillus sp. NE201]